MKKNRLRLNVWCFLAVSLFGFSSIQAQTTLKHSYTFEDGTANDVVGTAHGDVYGGATVENGTYSNNDQNSFIELPGSDIALNTYSSITLEAWITAGDNTNPGWSMLAYFGNPEGRDAYFFTIARQADNSVNAIHTGGLNPEAYGPELEDGAEHHLVSVVNDDSICWYIDGLLMESQQLGEGTIAGISTNLAYLGKSGWNDPLWNGSIHEFNIYEGEMTEVEVKAKASSILGGLKNANLSKIEVAAGTLKPALSPNVTEYTVTLPVGTTEIAASVVEAADVNAVVTKGNTVIDLSSGTGTEMINVVAENVEVEKDYTITYVVDVPLTLMHSYTFEDETANDVVGTAHGTLEGGFIDEGVYSSVGGIEHIILPGETLALNTYTSITTEAYIQTTASANTGWTVFSYFGDMDGNNAYFTTIARGDDMSRTAINSGGGEVVANGRELDDGEKHHLVSVLSTDSIYWYIDGFLVEKTAVGNNVISNISTANAFLCKGGWASDPRWNGEIYEFNIYEGQMPKETVKSKAGSFLGGLKDATLSTITVDGGSLKPAFNPQVTAYTVFLPAGTTEVSAATATTTDTNASATFGSGTVDVSSGSAMENIYVVAEDPSVELNYTINYIVDVPLALTHSYTFEDGTARDVISGADGTINGGVVEDGAYTAVADEEYITLPGTEIALNTYISITTEIYVTAGDTANAGYAMLTYFGDMNGDNAYYSIIARGDDSSRTGFRAGDGESNAGGIELEDGAKHHLVSVVSADFISWYIDGELVDQSEMNNNSISNISPANAWLGKGGWPDPTWRGSIHEFNIYEGQMDAATIKANAVAFGVNTGIAKHKASFANVYPSITGGSFTVDMGAQSGVVTVFDLSGKVVDTHVSNAAIQTIEIAKAGVYIFRIESNGQVQTAKVIKTN